LLTLQYEPSVVIDNREIGPGHYVIALQLPRELAAIEAGQFVSLRCNPGDLYSLLRPFSILSFDPDTRRMSVYYKILGRMSAQLAELHSGERVDVLYPLGKGFPHDPAWKRVALVGGGVGIAPLLLWQRELASKSPATEVHGYFGGRSEPDLVPELLAEYDFQQFLATDDGSRGFRGNAVSMFSGSGEAYDAIYTCGPNPMMAALKAVLPENASAFASLEEYMACSAGACYGCTALLIEDGGVERRATVCKEGPIFDLRKVVFET
jgi:dihydroorotate dehydrogenase electron transfer subunit